MAKFRKKPVVIEAIQWTGENRDEVDTWHDPGAFIGEILGGTRLFVCTLEGGLYADPGDWIIRGVKGEVYPCKPDIFALTYEEVVNA